MKMELYQDGLQCSPESSRDPLDKKELGEQPQTADWHNQTHFRKITLAEA